MPPKSKAKRIMELVAQGLPNDEIANAIGVLDAYVRVVRQRAKGVNADVKWRRRNPEKHREIKRRWARANPEKVREKVRRWQAANPEKVAAAAARYRARKRMAKRIAPAPGAGTGAE